MLFESLMLNGVESAHDFASISANLRPYQNRTKAVDLAVMHSILHFRTQQLRNEI